MARTSQAATRASDVVLIASNRRARFDYELAERMEAGLVLTGSEVKVLRAGAVNITEAWASIQNGEAFLEGMRIPALRDAAFGHKETRSRKLLLHRRQIRELEAAVVRQGMTVVVTRIYFRAGRVKVELAVARGKRKADKRESIRRRDAEQEAKAEMDRARKQVLR